MAISIQSQVVDGSKTVHFQEYTSPLLREQMKYDNIWSLPGR